MEEGYWNIRLNSSKEYFEDNSSTYGNWFWLENVPATAENSTVWVMNWSSWKWEPTNLSDEYGWTREFNFTIDIYDQEGDNVTCRLWIKHNSTGVWSVAGSETIEGTPGTPTQGECNVSYQGFSCADIGTSDFLWEIQDGEPTNQWNISVETLSLRESETNITISAGDGMQIDRNSETLPMTVFVFDQDNNKWPEGVNVSFWVSHNNVDLELDTTETTSSGNATYWFSPDCNYTVGIQDWVAGVNDGCFQDVNATQSTVTVFGTQKHYLLTPAGEAYLRGTNITIRGNVTDDCGQGLNDSYVNFTTTSDFTGTTFYCAPINNEGTGYYNCTFNTSEMPARWYDVTLNASRDYHHDGNQSWDNRFFVSTEPILTTPKVNTSTYDGNDGPNGGYSEAFNFSVAVTDEDGDTVTAYLWLRFWNETTSSWEDWTHEGTKVCMNCNNSVLSYTKYNFLCDNMGTWQYKWNATDQSDNPPGEGITYSDEVAPNNFTVEADDMKIGYYAGGGGWMWRNGTETKVLSTWVMDVDDQRNVSTGEVDGAVWITTNGTEWDSGHPVGSLAGFFNYTFSPACPTYKVGLQYWVAGTVGNKCFKDANSTTSNITLKTYLNGSVDSPNGEPYQRGNTIPFSFFIKDECNDGVAGITRVLHLFSGTTEYKIYSDVTDYGNGTYTYGWDSSSKVLGWYNVTFETSKENYVSFNATKDNAFHLGEPPELQLEQVDRVLGGWGETWTFEVQCRDLEGDTDNVQL
ncbi:hypothetical protein DRJ16_06660, partial [Candidatus Woesearchaeota archaeon]